MPNMTQNRLAATVFRWSIAALFVLWVFASRAQAQPAQAAKPISITGVYNGTYAFTKGPINFKLTITQPEPGVLEGVKFTFVSAGRLCHQVSTPVTSREQILSESKIRTGRLRVRGAS